MPFRLFWWCVVLVFCCSNAYMLFFIKLFSAVCWIVYWIVGPLFCLFRFIPGSLFVFWLFHLFASVSFSADTLSLISLSPPDHPPALRSELCVRRTPASCGPSRAWPRTPWSSRTRYACFASSIGAVGWFHDFVGKRQGARATAVSALFLLLDTVLHCCVASTKDSDKSGG